MITKDEIRDLLKDIENERVERTISTKDTDKFARAVCAFANDLPSLSLINHFYQVASCNLCLKNILRTKSKNSLTSFSIIFFKFQAVAAIKALICMPFSPHK